MSTLNPRSIGLAYHSDHYDIAGLWGFVDGSGREVVAPQYIYAYNFRNGIAIVAKGEWTRDPKRDGEPDQGLYRSEEELWGGIDKTGREVIPCIFDEIEHLLGRSDAYLAHIGGWENGRWGVIDRTGNWLAEPVFDGFVHEYRDGLIAFYAKNKPYNSKTVSMGIYDLENNKVLFEPQFINVNFLDDGGIAVEVFEEALGRPITKIIDRDGKARFPSVYSSIYPWGEYYEVAIRDGGERLRGLIDKSGRVLVPCKYRVAPDGFLHDRRRFILKRTGKWGSRITRVM